jgi:uncharacterized protein YecE (DUF72 family)
MNDKRRARLRSVLAEIEKIFEEEAEALSARPLNLQDSTQYKYHEERWEALDICKEDLKRAIFDYDFRLKEEDRKLAEELKRIQKRKSG